MPVRDAPTAIRHISLSAYGKGAFILSIWDFETPGAPDRFLLPRSQAHELFSELASQLHGQEKP